MASLIENVAAVKAASQAIDVAIREKGGTTAGGLKNAAAAIAAIPSRVESTDPSAVNFILHDGTIAKSYSAMEFAELTELPPQPTISGLIAQGWNYTLGDAKAYVAKYGRIDIGGMYVTDNGETRLYLRIMEDARLTQPLRFGRSGGDAIVVEWGDGESGEYTHTSQTIVNHTYPGKGNYVIRMKSVGGAKILLGGATNNNIFGSVVQSEKNPTRVYSSRLIKVEIGSSVTSIGMYAFNSCVSLSTIVIPNSVTSIGTYAFGNCSSLSSVVTPDSVTSIGTSAFSACSSLSSVVIPNSVTSIETNALYSCPSLLTIIIPDSVTSIGSSALYSCPSLSTIMIPDSVTSIGDSAFFQCFGVVKYDFTAATAVPSLGGSKAFYDISADCKIVVPDGLYDQWIIADTWSTSTIADHIVKASEYTGG